MELLPAGITPAMLREWADSYGRLLGGRDNNLLSVTLRHLADAIPRAGLHKCVEEARMQSLRLDNDALRAEAALLTTTRRRLVEEVMAQKERADRAEHDRDTWRRAAINLQLARVEDTPALLRCLADPHVRAALEWVAQEYLRATSENSPFNSAHEGYAVLLEETDELKAEVWKSPSRRDPAAMRKEAVQAATMGLRFVVDVCLRIEEVRRP